MSDDHLEQRVAFLGKQIGELTRFIEEMTKQMRTAGGVRVPELAGMVGALAIAAGAPRETVTTWGELVAADDTSQPRWDAATTIIQSLIADPPDVLLH